MKPAQLQLPAVEPPAERPVFALDGQPTGLDFEIDHTDWPVPVPNFHATPRGRALKDRIIKAVERLLA